MWEVFVIKSTIKNQFKLFPSRNRQAYSSTVIYFLFYFIITTSLSKKRDKTFFALPKGFVRSHQRLLYLSIRFNPHFELYTHEKRV